MSRNTTFLSLIIFITLLANSLVVGAECDLSEDANKKFNDYYITAQRKMDRGSYNVALENLESARELCDFKHYNILVAYCYDKLGEYGRALYTYEEFLKSNPQGYYADYARKRISQIYDGMKIIRGEGEQVLGKGEDDTTYYFESVDDPDRLNLPGGKTSLKKGYGTFW